MRFTHFIGIDWSGARGTRHAGLAVAWCRAGPDTPRIVKPPKGQVNWGRQDVLAWLAGGAGLKDGEQALVGIDSAYSLPWVDCCAFLPGIDSLPDRAADLWAAVEAMCAGGADLYGGGFVQAYRDYYHRTDGGKGQYYERRLRVAEKLSVARGHGPCESVFHLIGPSQVGLSGLSTVRMLHRVSSHPDIAIWPFQETEGARIVLVEIYAALFAHMAGHRGKVRDASTLTGLLAALDSGGVSPRRHVDDHTADALLTAAGLRKIAALQKYWNPEGLSSRVRSTEGWIFGIA